tara:strand:- start:466 stop:765 length:300 start_codon:yes stop_codon:yes gene_type:complete
MISGMGGAMDLVVGAKKVIVTMEHITKHGAPKILKHCTLPLTGRGVVNIILTDLALIAVEKEGLILKEIAPGVEKSEVIEKTDATLIIAPDLKTMFSNL